MTAPQGDTHIEGFAIIELFGHNKIAGRVSTIIIGTSGMVRVDVPALGDTPGFTRFYGPSAIYSLTLVSEDVARAALVAMRPEPVTVYMTRQLPPGFREDYEEDYEEDDER